MKRGYRVDAAEQRNAARRRNAAERGRTGNRRLPVLCRTVLALCAVLTVGAAGLAAEAAGLTVPDAPASGTAGDDVRWTMDDTGTLNIRGTGPMEDYVGAGRAPWQPHSAQILRVRVGDGVTRVGNYSFMDLANLEEAEIGNDVEIVGNYAFYDCGSLERVSLGADLRELGTGAFSRCASLRDPVLPDSLEIVGQSAFSCCDSLETPELPYQVTELKAYAFSNCPRLRRVDLPDTLRSIGTRAFENCAVLSEIEIPRRLTTLGPGAFDRCSALREVNLPITLDRISSGAFAYSGLESVVIPNGAAEIDAEAFRGCDALQYAVVGRSVTEIAEGAFRDCPLLTDVYYPGTESRWDSISMDDFRSQILYQGIAVHLESSGPEENSDGGSGTDGSGDGTGGVYIASVAMSEGGGVQVEISGDPGRNSVLVAAAYAADGRLLDTAMTSAAGGGTRTLFLAAEEAESVSAFLLDGRGCPMAGQVRSGTR